MSADFSRSALGVLAAIVTTLLMPVTVQAQGVFSEAEPNNEPATANEVAGAVTILGTLEGRDQDAFRWSVSDVDAQARWVLELDGVAGTVTSVEIFRVELAESGADVVAREKLLKVSSGGTKPEVVEDLLFEPGEYYLGVAHAGSGSGGYKVHLRRGRKLVLDNRASDNTEQSSAHPLRVSTEYAAFKASEESWFQFDVDDEAAASRWRARAWVPVGVKARLRVRDANGTTLTTASVGDRGALVTDDLNLEPGAYFATIESQAEGSVRAIEVFPAGPRKDETASVDRPGTPTKSWKTADHIDLEAPHRGRFGESTEEHFLAFELDESFAGEVLALRAEATVERRIDLCLLNTAGKAVQCRSGPGAAELPSLLLSPGSWGLSVKGLSGEAAEYTLALAREGALEASSEAEPNDKAPLAREIVADQRIRGGLNKGDEDFFRLRVAGEGQLWRFSAEGEEIRLRYHDGAGSQAQEAKSFGGVARLSNFYLAPGEHFVSIRGNKGSYSLVAEPLGPPDPDSEREPNSDATRAEVLTLGAKRFGLLETTSDYDFYRFSLTNDEHVRLTVEAPDGAQLRAYLDYDQAEIANQRVDGGTPGVLQGMFPPGDYRVRLRATRPQSGRYYLRLERLARFGCSVDCDPIYRRKLDFGDAGNPVEAPARPGVTLELTTARDSVAAYLRSGQRVGAKLKIENRSAETVDLKLEGATSDARWTLEPALEAVHLGSGESQAVDLEILAPADAWANQPVIVSVRAVGGDGAQVETAAEIAVDSRAEPSRPELAWTMPATMRGGANAAWAVLGGRLAGVPDGAKPEIKGVGRRLAELFDARVGRTFGPVIDSLGDSEGIPVTVELAGEKPLEVVGVILNPLAREKAAHYMDEFQVQLSLDGNDFETVLTGRLKQLPTDQAFALAEPYPARFARLLVVSAHDRRTPRGPGIGEFKVVVRPGTDLSGGKGWNLADPSLGGHVVRAEPVIRGAWDRDILTVKQEHPAWVLRAGQEAEWVVSFQHQRAARVARFEWVESDRATPQNRIDRIAISVAHHSPVGPWTKVAEWDRASAPGELVLESPAWARYVRFSYSHAGPAERTRVYVPATLRIFEQPSDADYSSILGEWGQESWQAQYELDQGLPAAETSIVSGNNSRAQAADLPLDQLTSGTVMLGEEEDWYRVVVPAGGNTLQVALSGTPTVRAIVGLLDASGLEVPWLSSGTGSRSLLHRAAVKAGATYYLRVEEPPRAVVFAFDNSGSVQPFREAIYGAVNAYAGDLVPGRDVAHIMPFGDFTLTSGWVGDPHQLQLILNDYDRDAVSSAAEESLGRSTKLLEERPGVKAVVLVTDAATPRMAEMWRSLDEVQPRVFTMRVGEADSTGLFEDLMQSWARVNDGHYDYLSTQGEMDRAFDRAATLLRRPAAYSLEAESTVEKPPSPGQLQVTGQGLAGGAVALILDASGSMLKRLEGRRRIEIAKELLSKAAGEHIPAGTPVALRVFGHKEANSCRTDLVVPMAPLDREVMKATLAGINARNLAKTPIAASLARVEADLKGAKGTRVVVLVTDGEETCDGDPEAEVRKLMERGVDLRLEIVGFAISDADLKQQFEGWAQQGGGRYFDAGDTASLESSLAEAMRTPFTVFDGDGEVVAEGTVDGEAVELPPGRYRVVVRTSPVATFDEVEVSEKQLQRLELE